MRAVRRLQLLIVLLIAALSLQLQVDRASAQAGPTPGPTPCAGTKVSDVVTKMKVNGCLSTDAADTGISGNLGSYYGWVALDTGGAFTVTKKSAFLKQLLGAITGYDERKTTIASVVISRNISGVDTIIFEKPLAEISRVAGKKDEITVAGIATKDMRVTPFFVPDSGSADLVVRVKLSSVETYKGDDLVTAKKGVDPGAAVTGSLVSGIAELPYAVIVNRLYIGLLSSMSSSVEYSKPIVMSFDSAGSYKKADFEIDLDTANTVKFSVKLLGRKSLITTDTTAAGLVDFTAVQGARFADRINVVSPTTQLPVTLSSYLDTNNIPRKLIELTPAFTPAPTSKDAVDLACMDLRNALSSSPIKLSFSDVRAILHNELATRGVLAQFDPRTMKCTSGDVTYWKTSLAGLEVPEPVVLIPMTLADKGKRLLLLAKAWANGDAAQRSGLLQDAISGANISVIAPADLFPNPYIAAGPDGRITQPLSASGLASRMKKCFGNFKPSSPETLAQATAFAQFDGVNPSYLVKIQFEDRLNFDPAFGPRVKAFDIKVADDEDKVNFNQKSEGDKCF